MPNPMSVEWEKSWERRRSLDLSPKIDYSFVETASLSFKRTDHQTQLHVVFFGYLSEGELRRRVATKTIKEKGT